MCGARGRGSGNSELSVIYCLQKREVPLWSLPKKLSPAARSTAAASSASGRTPSACPTARPQSARWRSTPAAWGFWHWTAATCCWCANTATETPAGKREPGEEPFVTAQRELREEIGATAGKWTELGALIASPGCYGEVLYLYMAQELTFGDTHPDEDEFLDVVRMPFDRAVELCMTGELTDAKTVIALLKGKLLR